jgi:aryl-alcohol dehydrogenase-like predicted oxidoreductase
VRIGVSTSGSAQADAVRRAVAVTVDQVAIAAALAQPWARRVLSGAVTVAQLRANLDSAAVRLGPDEVAGLTSRPEPPEQYWSQRSSRAWT